jgi:hypothetical protein
VAGKYAEWKWEKEGKSVVVGQYTVVYQGISGRDVIKETRAVSSCYPAELYDPPSHA